MNVTILLRLLSAHLLADFFLQSDKLCKAKNPNAWTMGDTRIRRIRRIRLWRKQIKKFVAFPRLTPLQPGSDVHPCKHASLSEPPHLSGLPGGRRKATKQNSCRWQYKKAPLEPQRYPSTGGEFPVLGMFLLSFYHGLNRQNGLACGYWVQDKNIKNPLERMEGFALLLCFRSGLIRASS